MPETDMADFPRLTPFFKERYTPDLVAFPVGCVQSARYHYVRGSGFVVCNAPAPCDPCLAADGARARVQMVVAVWNATAQVWEPKVYFIAGSRFQQIRQVLENRGMDSVLSVGHDGSRYRRITVRPARPPRYLNQREVENAIRLWNNTPLFASNSLPTPLPLPGEEKTGPTPSRLEVLLAPAQQTHQVVQSNSRLGFLMV